MSTLKMKRSTALALRSSEAPPEKTMAKTTQPSDPASEGGREATPHTMNKMLSLPSLILSVQNGSELHRPNPCVARYLPTL